MSNVTISPVMDMPIPNVGQELGPQWAQDLNNCLNIIDVHQHSVGTGNQITPNGININSDLSFNGNNATSLRSVRFAPQSSLLSGSSDVGCLYESGVDLYYNDGAGNQIRFTQGGTIAGAAGTITGLPSGTASASYSSGTFIFQSATNTPASVDGGSFIFRDIVANSHGVTVSPVNSLTNDYSLILPLLPPVQSIMTLDSSGNMSAPWTVDNSTIVVQSNIIKVPSQGITATQIANQTITATQIANNTITNTQMATPGLSIGDTVVTFSGAGSYTWTVPPYVTRVIVKAVGGGGGGGGGANGTTGGGAGGSGGQGGATYFNSVKVAIGGNGGFAGSGGTGGLPASGPNYADFYFGGGGGNGNAGGNSGQPGPGFNGGVGYNAGGGGASSFAAGNDGGGINGSGGPGSLGSGGGGGGTSSSNPYGGSGGGGAGAKATINVFSVTPAQSIPIVIGAGGGYGASGGGAAGNGGAGGDGYMVIYY